MLPRQTMSMLWYMILFSVYGLKKKRESDYKILLFRLCGVYGFLYAVYVIGLDCA